MSIVTLVPGTGDEVQALKAGIMEIADIFVVNKADREGAERLVSAVEANLALHTYAERRVAAADREDRGDDRAGRRRAGRRDRAVPRALAGTQAARRRTRSEYRLRELVSQRFMDHLEREVLAAASSAAIVDRIAAREVDPYTAADDARARAGDAAHLESPDHREFVPRCAPIA